MTIPSSLSIRVLLLEPDTWLFLRMARVLERSPGVHFLGDKDYGRVLAARPPSFALVPEVILIADTLLQDLGIQALQQLKQRFATSQILVHGYASAVKTIASVIARGARGTSISLPLPSNYSWLCAS